MSDMGSKAVQEARTWIGTPYRHQASAKGSGADCLGLIRGVWRALYGTEPEVMPAYSPDWSEARGEERLWRAAMRHLIPLDPDIPGPGQLLLFRMRDGGVAKHLGLSAEARGADSFIHAYSGHGVLECALTSPWQRRIVARFAFPEGV